MLKKMVKMRRNFSNKTKQNTNKKFNVSMTFYQKINKKLFKVTVALYQNLNQNWPEKCGHYAGWRTAKKKQNKTKTKKPEK